MRINQDIPKVVVFVGLETERGFTPLGTGSLVAHEVEGHTFLFVMTASHIIEGLDEAVKSRFAMRLNRLNGPAECVRLNLAALARHPNKANDLTLIPVRVDPSIYDVGVCHGNREAFESQRASNQGTKSGDYVCAVGLYTSHYGSVSNTPVVRMGNIAAVPTEPMWTDRGYVEAYLIELRTIAGLSGSPVFQVSLPVRIVKGQVEFRNQDDAQCSLIGMLIGYHVLESKEDQITAPRLGPQPASGDAGRELSRDERNTGFGVVIPIERAFEVFEGPLKEGFLNVAKLMREQSGFKPAAG